MTIKEAFIKAHELCGYSHERAVELVSYASRSFPIPAYGEMEVQKQFPGVNEQDLINGFAAVIKQLECLPDDALKKVIRDGTQRIKDDLTKN